MLDTGPLVQHSASFVEDNGVSNNDTAELEEMK